MIGTYSGPRRARSRPTKYWEAIINSVRPRNRTYSTARSCLRVSGDLAGQQARDGRREQAAQPDSPTRSEKRLPSAVSVPGLSLAKSQTISRP